MLLALDTATNAVTVALHDGSDVVAESSTENRLRSGELLAPAIDALLRSAGVAPSDLGRIAAGVGPGPYTGLRIGLATATTMAAALGIEVVGVCTLDVLAAAVRVQGPFLVATDARRREVYWARYSDALVRASDPAVDLPVAVATELAVAGNAPSLYPHDFPNPVPPPLPRAGDLARLVASGAAALLPPLPLYLRRPDAVVPTVRRRVT
ncbi:MAG: tRNA (adenosine(37)-N6)-threonylcarbamoyltransferase complex dimerization subunit type 1 TsaB [Nocardioidaceae bacterium]